MRRNFREKPTGDNEYLKEAGWTFNGRGWEDPRSKQPTEDRDMGSTKMKDGTDLKLVQTICPPIPWTYTEEEAVAIAETREKELVHNDA